MTNNPGEVHVRWRGLLGNRLFQLAGGLVLSIESGARLRSLPITGFPYVDFAPPADNGATYRTSSVQPAFHRESWVEWIRNGNDICVDGHHESYVHYADHKAAIRTLLFYDHDPSFSPGPDDLVVHVRLTGHNSREPYDLRELAANIERWRSHRVIILSDAPDHEWFRQYDGRGDTIVMKDTTERDFATLMRATRLVLTPSTYGWWAAFLSRAETIYFPDRQGVWRRPYIDLFVYDEPRYLKY